jgi:hypothetical protein
VAFFDCSKHLLSTLKENVIFLELDIHKMRFLQYFEKTHNTDSNRTNLGSRTAISVSMEYDLSVH